MYSIREGNGNGPAIERPRSQRQPRRLPQEERYYCYCTFLNLPANVAHSSPRCCPLSCMCHRKQPGSRSSQALPSSTFMGCVLLCQAWPSKTPIPPQRGSELAEDSSPPFPLTLFSRVPAQQPFPSIPACQGWGLCRCCTWVRVRGDACGRNSLCSRGPAKRPQQVS